MSLDALHGGEAAEPLAPKVQLDDDSTAVREAEPKNGAHTHPEETELGGPGAELLGAKSCQRLAYPGGAGVAEKRSSQDAAERVCELGLDALEHYGRKRLA